MQTGLSTAGSVPFATFVDKVRTGWVATQIKEGASGNAHHLATWKFAEPWTIGAELLVGEVADEIEQLNGRPTSSERCMQAVERFVADPSDENRARVAEASWPRTRSAWSSTRKP